MDWWKLLRRETKFGKVVVFTILLFIWTIAYLVFMRFFNQYLIAHPDFSNITAFIIYFSFLSIGVFLLSFVVDGLIFAWRYFTALMLGFLGFSLLQAPMCINLATGTIMNDPTNATCRLSLDVFMLNITTGVFHITGMWAAIITYGIFGFLLLWIGGIRDLLVLREAGVKDKEK